MEQTKKLNLDLEHKLDKTIADINYISLNDLEELKEGLSDPSQESANSLKRLFSHIAGEVEIDNYLVKPFCPKPDLR